MSERETYEAEVVSIFRDIGRKSIPRLDQSDVDREMVAQNLCDEAMDFLAKAKHRLRLAEAHTELRDRYIQDIIASIGDCSIDFDSWNEDIAIGHSDEE